MAIRSLERFSREFSRLTYATATWLDEIT